MSKLIQSPILLYERECVWETEATTTTSSVQVPNPQSPIPGNRAEPYHYVEASYA
jgi:hypothetical protein